uniref:Uncharacterized protein n=1 Tax=Panagrolaimus sp. ES5 TaxID=591445 RepID=A0AC34FWY6_9BILA
MSQTLYGYFHATKDCTMLSTVDSATNEFFGRIEFGSGKELLDAIDILPKNSSIQYFIVNLFQLRNHEFSCNMAFCKAVKEKLNTINAQHRFISYTQIVQSSALIAANVSPKIDDIILMVLIHDQKYIVHEMKYTKTGFKKHTSRIIEANNENETSQITKSKILSSCNPSKIIGYSTCSTTSFKKLKNIFKSTNFVVVNNDQLRRTEAQCVCEMVKWMKNKRFTKFYIHPTIFQPYFLVGLVGNVREEIFTIDCGEELPLERSAIVSKPFQFCSIVCCDLTEPKPFDYGNIQGSSHRYNVKFKIDSEYFPNFEVTSVSVHGVKHLTHLLDYKMKEKIPVIGFFDTSSVICVSKENKNYKFLDEWNGVHGNELFINFDKEKHQFGSNTVTPFHTEMSHVVYDLIKIMSMSAEKIIADEKWKFIFTKNAENPVLIEFDNFDGTKKAASPAFLMAMLLKEHLKVIKTAIGKKPKKVAFCLIYDFTKDERKRVEEQLQESCKFIQIDCSFVNV